MTVLWNFDEWGGGLEESDPKREDDEWWWMVWCFLSTEFQSGKQNTTTMCEKRARKWNPSVLFVFFLIKFKWKIFKRIFFQKIFKRIRNSRLYRLATCGFVRYLTCFWHSDVTRDYPYFYLLIYYQLLLFLIRK